MDRTEQRRRALRGSATGGRLIDAAGSPEPSPRDVRVFAELESLARGVVAAMRPLARQAIAARGRFTVALSGGTTPDALFRALAADAGSFPWADTDLFWVDERWVPPDDPASNVRRARELLLDHVPVRAERVHAPTTEGAGPAADAARYEARLRDLFAGEAWPAADLQLLGLGTDGHTASLFPGDPALGETERWVTAGSAPTEPCDRLTLTLPAIGSARQCWFLVSGAAKRDALARVWRGEPLPAGQVRARERVVWWVDRAAAPEL